MTTTTAPIDQLRAGLRGQVILPGDGGYDQARRVWNGNIDRSPAIIARCTGPADVIEALRYARANGLVVAVRGGAHNAAGHGTCDGGIVIDLTGMKGIWVSPEERTARAQPGVVWSELDHETQAFGLATTGGMVSNTGIAGLTLGGGLGWLMGKHGLSVDNLLSVDIVTADGQLRHASATENPDLFWAVRGGGGNFGIVTSFEYQLHPVGPLVLGGLVAHPLAAARDVLRFYREFSAGLPDEAEVHAGLLTHPEAGPIVALVMGYNGSIEEGERVLRPAREFGAPIADLVQPMPYSARQAMLDEPNAIHGLHRYWKSGFTETITDKFIDEIIAGAESFTSPLSSILLFRVHGAGTRVPQDATAFGMRGAKWDFNVISQWGDPSESAQHTAWGRNLWSRLEPLISGTAYVNHLAGDDSIEKVRASFGPNYARLLELKRRYDPDNVFCLNPNIDPRA